MTSSTKTGAPLGNAAPGIAPPAHDARVDARTWIAVAAGLLGAFMAVLDIQITNSSLRDILGTLSATQEEGSWISTAYLCAEIVVIPMTALFTRSGMLSRLNGEALSSPKVRVVNADAFRWVRDNRRRFDAVVVDFPDPSSFSIGKLYTTTFYRELARALAPGGVASIQSTSPLAAPNAYWTVSSTLEAAGLRARGYHAYVPSFGEWGFILASPAPIRAPGPLPPGLRFLTPVTDRLAFVFPPDMARRPTPVNRLDNQALVRQFEAEWSRVEG